MTNAREPSLSVARSTARTCAVHSAGFRTAGESRSVAQFGDDPERLLAARHALEIIEGIAPALPMIVPSRPGTVRAENRVLQCEKFMVGLWRLFDHDVEP